MCTNITVVIVKTTGNSLSLCPTIYLFIFGRTEPTHNMPILVYFMGDARMQNIHPCDQGVNVKHITSLLITAFFKHQLDSIDEIPLNCAHEWLHHTHKEQYQDCFFFILFGKLYVADTA